MIHCKNEPDNLQFCCCWNPFITKFLECSIGIFFPAYMYSLKRKPWKCVALVLIAHCWKGPFYFIDAGVQIIQMFIYLNCKITFQLLKISLAFRFTQTIHELFKQKIFFYEIFSVKWTNKRIPKSVVITSFQKKIFF